MNFRVYTGTDNENRSEILDLLVRVDEDATEDNYEVSTADMSRDMYDLDSDISDKQALAHFIDKETWKMIVCFEQDEPIGLTIIQKNYEYFAIAGAEEYFPHIAVIFSAVHPDHQRQGIWTALRQFVEDNIVPEYDVNFLVSAASKENTASLNANKSMGMKEKGLIDIEEEDATVLLVKTVN